MNSKILALLAIGLMAEPMAASAQVVVGSEFKAAPLDMPFIAPNQFLAQPFTITTGVLAQEVVFAIGDGARTNGPNDSVGLQFTMELTNAIGSTATAANVLSQATFTYPGSSSASTVPVNYFGSISPLTWNVGTYLNAGTYYLVASATSTGQNESVGWLQAVDSIQVGTNGVAGGALGSCCTPASFAPASSFIPVSPASEPAYQFEICSGVNCPLTIIPPPPTAAPEVDPTMAASGLTLLMGALAVIRGRRKLDS
jgi:hypothetical protein